jgi:23S rRNA (uracil747-C5)-methyltransferase
MKTFCSYFNHGVCRSCDLITSDYSDQILSKEKTLRESFQLKNLIHPPLLKTVESAPQNFRNKAKLVVTGDLENPILGLWGEKNLDAGRELLECGLHDPAINAALPKIKEFIKLAKLVPYQISTKKGELKGIILFYSSGSNESYLRFVLRSKESIDRIKKNLAFLEDKFDCVSVNIQPISHAVLEGEEEIFITEKQSIQHKLGTHTFSLGPRAFVQTNQSIAEKLYQTAASWVKDMRQPKFLELFCGQGAFSFFCAPYVEESLGVEINEAAIIEANKTALALKLKHLNFKSADAAKMEIEIQRFDPSIILVNPPRRGLAEVVHLILRHRPECVVYSSCNYQTLAEDLKLMASDYAITKIQIFDMFPHTSHFETLVELRKKPTQTY